MLARYPAAGEVVWVQEEPRNMGAWAFVRGWIQPMLQAQHRQIGYAGRPESASTAPGSSRSARAGAGRADRTGVPSADGGADVVETSGAPQVPFVRRGS